MEAEEGASRRPEMKDVAARAVAVGEGAVETVAVEEEEGTISAGRPNLNEP